MVPFAFWVLYTEHFQFGWRDGIILPLIIGCLFHIVVLILPAIFFPGTDLMVLVFTIIGGIVLPFGIGKIKQDQEELAEWLEWLLQEWMWRRENLRYFLINFILGLLSLGIYLYNNR